VKKLIQIFSLTSVLIASMVVWAGVHNSTHPSDAILAGHDAVAYFTEGKPTLGSADFTAQYESATYLFASAQNRDLFKANPDKYAPAYGGFCAYGATFGKKIDVDGKAFEIVDGQLYVNKNRRVYNTWKKDIPGNIAKADRQWKTIKDIPADQL